MLSASRFLGREVSWKSGEPQYNPWSLTTIMGFPSKNAKMLLVAVTGWGVNLTYGNIRYTIKNEGLLAPAVHGRFGFRLVFLAFLQRLGMIEYAVNFRGL